MTTQTAPARPRTLAARLPRFPWEMLEPAKATAQAHPGGIVDLSIGTPVDPVPDLVRQALAAASDSPGYPTAGGTPQLREAAAAYLERQHGVRVSPDAVLPLLGSKELISGLPTALGLGPGDLVVYPALAYPTYDIGVRLAGATAAATDSLVALGPEQVRLAWINSPSNPTGQVLPAEHLRKVVTWARERGVIVASDECYIELGFGVRPVSVLHPDACDGSHQGLLALHSLSKRSNMAGYRCGFVTGDPELIAGLLEIRKHAGMLMPAPVQAAMTAALADEEHARQQHARYAGRHDRLLAALQAAGWAVSRSSGHSAAGLFLWASHRDHDCWESVRILAEIGILVAPGELYGRSGTRHIRAALTATDERIDAAVSRLAQLA